LSRAHPSTEGEKSPSDSTRLSNPPGKLRLLIFVVQKNTSLRRPSHRLCSFYGVIERNNDGKLIGGKRIHVHLIEAEDVISKLAASSKMNAEWRFLTYLFNVGRERADKWLSDNFGSIGSKSTIDLDDKYM
jgi:hypothetical protein